MSETLEDWLKRTQERREALDAFGKSSLPTDSGERHMDQDIAIQCAHDAGLFLADAETFLTQATAKAIYKIKESCGEFSADERRHFVKNEVRDIQRMVDGISVTHKTIQTRLTITMSQAKESR